MPVYTESFFVPLWFKERFTPFIIFDGYLIFKSCIGSSPLSVTIVVDIDIDVDGVRTRSLAQTLLSMTDYCITQWHVTLHFLTKKNCDYLFFPYPTINK